MVFRGSSIGKLTGAGAIDGAIVYYRCVRNLGIPKNAAKTVRPDDFATYDEATRTITLTRLDAKSIRGFKTSEELDDHNERRTWLQQALEGFQNKLDNTRKQFKLANCHCTLETRRKKPRLPCGMASAQPKRTSADVF